MPIVLLLLFSFYSFSNNICKGLFDGESSLLKIEKFANFYQASRDSNITRENKKAIEFLLESAKAKHSYYLRDQLLQIQQKLESSETSKKEIRHLNKILKPIDFEKGVSPRQWEVFIFRLEAKSLMQKVRNKSLPSFKVKAVVKQKVDRILSLENLNTLSKQKGFYRENSLKDHLHYFHHVHHYMVRVLGLSLDVVSIAYTGFPLYLPQISSVEFLRLKPETLEKVKKEGFNAVYKKEIINKHRMLFIFDRFSQYMPQWYGLYFSLRFSYDIAVKLWPEDAMQLPTHASITEGQIYRAWQEVRQENGASYNIRIDAEAKQAWLEHSYSIYTSIFSKKFEERFKRKPDLENVQDRAEWKAFNSDYYLWMQGQ